MRRRARRTGRWRRRVLGLLAMVASLSVLACAQPLRLPMERIDHPKQQGERSRRLMVLLPGIGDEAADYARHGLIDAARDAGLEADMVAVGAHYSYYASDEIVRRLYQEVIAPARREYAEVWLVGISLGGLGAILTARAHPDAIDGVILLAPYLGPRHMARTIAAEGGMRAWEPPPPPSAYDWDVELWTWLKRYEDPRASLPTLLLAYGRQDFLSLEHRLLAEILPADHVIVEDGAHYWETWAGLWERVVARGPAVMGEHGAPWRSPQEVAPRAGESTAAVLAAPAL